MNTVKKNNARVDKYQYNPDMSVVIWRDFFVSIEGRKKIRHIIKNTSHVF